MPEIRGCGPSRHSVAGAGGESLPGLSTLSGCGCSLACGCLFHSVFPSPSRLCVCLSHNSFLLFLTGVHVVLGTHYYNLGRVPPLEMLSTVTSSVHKVTSARSRELAQISRGWGSIHSTLKVHSDWAEPTCPALSLFPSLPFTLALI